MFWCRVRFRVVFCPDRKVGPLRCGIFRIYIRDITDYYLNRSEKIAICRYTASNIDDRKA
ncbi:hypothetical protein HanRHA438_Chr04g0196921 [Helianthus annuus]|nr:hypothetical protein HanIR_Chr04g0201631 [Helianthus annuus]KAJ0928696.1 hypothetical protein HanRHA438_Chr04g0196921 [Helianthus annuus]